MSELATTPFDALLVVSFGGPEGPDEVMPFLRRVTAGRNVTDDRLRSVAGHYDLFGGRSPINALNRALVAAVRARLVAAGSDLPVYLGNRNSDPLLADVFGRLAADGHHRVAVFLTSAYSSWSSCRQYRENLAAAAEASGVRLDLALLPHFWDHPGFVLPFADGLRAAFAELPKGSRPVFVTHSIPDWMNASSGTDPGTYVAQHRRTAHLVASAAGVATTSPEDLVFCSRSGPPTMPWLEPDINEHIRSLAAAGVPGVAVVPIGFVSDHMEVVYDLDTEAAATAAELGLVFRRVPTPGPDPRFVDLVLDLLAAVGSGSAPGQCPAGCCRNPRSEAPALCGADSV